MLLQTLFVYIGLVILMTVSSVWARQKHYKIRILVPVLIFSVIFGFRYGVGIDFYSYLESYYDSASIVNSYYEPGYVFILNLCRKINLGPELFFTMLAFLQIFFIYYAFNTISYKPVSHLAVYLIFTGLAMTGFMNNIRQTIALAIFIFSIHFISEKKVVQFYIFCFLAFLFHKSAIILMIIYPIWRFAGPFFNKIKAQVLLMFIVFALSSVVDLNAVLSYFDLFIINLGYERYLDDSRVSATGFGIGYILLFIQYLIVVLSSKRMKEYFNSKTLNIMYDLFFIGILCEFLFAGSMILNRFAWYFNGFKIVLIPTCLYYLYKNLRISRINTAYYIVSVLILIYLFIRLMMNSADNTTQFVFSFQKELLPLKDMQVGKFF